MFSGDWEVLLDTSERFLRFAAECEAMAKSSPTPVSKAVWQQLARRWIRCADLACKDNSTAYIERLRMRQLKAANAPMH
jgi:hypothetical protein